MRIVPVLIACSMLASAAQLPNIVFLICESIDGRTWRPASPVPIPNLRSLMQSGVRFDTHYANAPVCCPSRSSIWSGRAPHKLPHMHDNIHVNGVWNNFEGNDKDYDKLIGNLLDQGGYNVKISGKTDWTVGGHSMNVRLDAWTMNVPFVYNVSANGGWNLENGVCGDDGSVAPGSKSVHQGDWDTLKSTTAWIQEAAKGDKPFFAYQGMNIVHPPYNTNERWYNAIDPSQVIVPEWAPLDKVHPCDFQMSMLKGCTPSLSDTAKFYNTTRRQRIRRIYYAMIAEFDAMVGEYVQAVKDAGVMDNTYFIITADHGDMNMEHQQFYKMVPYDASALVPLVVSHPKIAPKVVTSPTSHVDLYPTMMDLGAVTKPSFLDGYSLLPLLSGEGAPSDRPDFIVSQFHGDDIAMSWFLVRQGDYKFITYGTGKEVPVQLFNVATDPGEMNNIASTPEGKKRVADMENTLMSYMDYPSVAMDVAQYGKDMFTYWMNTTKDWESALDKSGLRWHTAWKYDIPNNLKALKEWIAKPAYILPCRSETVWPPPK